MASLRVKVRLAARQNGNLLLAVFNSPECWMRMDAITIKASQPCPADGLAIFELPEVPAGTYACCVLVDSNANHQMDFNIAGYPMEDFAFSNQAIGAFGPPVFQQAGFEFDGSGDLEIDVLIE